MTDTARERLERVNDLGRPEGAYTVELADAHTGRLVERVEAPNYISPAYERAVRWYQGGHFHDGYQAVANGIAAGPGGMGPLGTGSTDVDWLSPPRFNADAVILTDSAIAENSSSEWGTGRTIAWGSRYKLTIPASGRRGQINESQSLLSNDVVRLVWDFVETQGNGTFQSIQLAQHDQYGNLTLPSAGYHWRYSNPGGVDLTVDLNATYIDAAGTNAYGVAVETSSGAGVSGDPIGFYRIDLDTGTDNGDHYQCASPTKLFTLADVTYSTSSGAGTATSIRFGSVIGVAPYGADWLICWPGDNGTTWLNRYTSAGVRVWGLLVTGTTFLTGNPCSAAGVAVSGDQAFVSPGYGYTMSSGDGLDELRRIHRVDLTQNPPVIDATYDLGERRPRGIQLLGSDLAVLVSGTSSDVDLQTNITDQQGVYRITTGGVHAEYLGNPVATSRADTLVSPWPGGTSVGAAYHLHRERRHDRRVEYAGTGNELYLGAYSTSTANDWERGYLEAILVGGGNKLYGLSVPGAATNGARAIYQLGGSNIYSRTVLGSPQAKSSSQTMQVTYELTLPSSWRGRPAHVSPPS